MTNLNAVYTTNQIAVQSNLPPPAGFVVSRAEGSSHPVLEANATRTVRHASAPLSLPGSILGNCFNCPVSNPLPRLSLLGAICTASDESRGRGLKTPLPSVSVRVRPLFVLMGYLEQASTAG